MAFDKAVEIGALEKYHGACVTQIERARKMIFAREAEPDDEDYSCGF
jgi:hypothetical protein